MFICWDLQCKMNNTALDFVQTFKGALDKYNIILRKKKEDFYVARSVGIVKMEC